MDFGRYTQNTIIDQIRRFDASQINRCSLGLGHLTPLDGLVEAYETKVLVDITHTRVGMSTHFCVELSLAGIRVFEDACRNVCPLHSIGFAQDYRRQ
jgi:hypothetical protein